MVTDQSNQNSGESSRQKTNRKLRILIVDDIEVNRKVVKMGLDKLPELYAGITVAADECDSGDSAIDVVQAGLFKRIHYDCVIIDYFMPGKHNGLEAARAIHIADPKVVLIGYSDEYFKLQEEIKKGLPRESLDCFKDFLEKKFKSSDLYEILDNQLGLVEHQESAPSNEENVNARRASGKQKTRKV